MYCISQGKSLTHALHITLELLIFTGESTFSHTNSTNFQVNRDHDFQNINSFKTEVPIIWKLVHWFALQINGLVSIWYGPTSWKSYIKYISIYNIIPAVSDLNKSMLSQYYPSTISLCSHAICFAWNKNFSNSSARKNRTWLN